MRDGVCLRTLLKYGVTIETGLEKNNPAFECDVENVAATIRNDSTNCFNFKSSGIQRLQIHSDD